MRYLVVMTVFFITLVFNYFILQQLDFVLKWNIVKKLRVDAIEARVDKLEKETNR